MRIVDLRATTVAVPLEAPLRHAKRLPLGPFRSHHRRNRNRHRVDRARRNGRRRRIRRSRHPRPEDVSRGSRSRAARGDAVSARQSHRIALQQPHADGRRHRVRLSRSAGTGVGRPRVRHSRRPRPRPRDLCVVSVLPIRRAAGAGTIRTSRSGRRLCARDESDARVYHVTK